MKARQGWMIWAALMIGMAFFAAGCGKSDATAGSTGNAGSCSLVSSGFTTCIDYTGSGFTTTAAQSACSQSSTSGTTGTYSSSACTTTGRVGTCKVNAGQATEESVRYFTGYTDTTASAACTGLKGTYTSG